MSSLVAAIDRLVSADHRMFGIADYAGTTNEDQELPDFDARWLGINPNQVIIRTGQDGMDIKLRIELWDNPPSALPGGYEVSQTITLEMPTGRVSINQIAIGWVHDVFQVPAGWYRVRLTAWDRERMKRLYWEIGDRTDFRPGNREFAALLDGVHDRERYLAEFWPLASADGDSDVMEERHG